MYYPSSQAFGRQRAFALAATGLGLTLLASASQAQINRGHPQGGSAPPVRVAPPVNVLPRGNTNYGQSGIGSYGGNGYAGSALNLNSLGGRQNGLDFNSLFPRGNSLNIYSYQPVIQTRALRNNSTAANRLNGIQNDPNRNVNGNRDRLHDVLFGGTVEGSIPSQPDRLHDVLFGGRGVPDSNARVAYRRFNNSSEGFRYNNGLQGRPHHHYYYGWGSAYFINSGAYYPYYYPGYFNGLAVYSPYWAYYGVLPPYIGSSSVYVQPPQYVYVPYPVYNDYGRYQGWQNSDVDDYYLNQDEARPQPKAKDQNDYRIGEDKDSQAKDRKLVDTAVADLSKAWHEGDIQTLSKYIRRDSGIAVYLRGKYQYSLDASDYLDLTRDAFDNMTTIRFELDHIRRKENGVYALSGRHIYRNKDGSRRTVYVSFVLEKMDGQYVITQVGTAPDKIEDPGDNGANPSVEAPEQ